MLQVLTIVIMVILPQAVQTARMGGLLRGGAGPDRPRRWGVRLGTMRMGGVSLGPTQLDSGYCFRLADGQGWHIIATEGVRPWVEKLASIMQLKTCEPNGFLKRIFIQRESREINCEYPLPPRDENILEHLPRIGWIAHNLGALQIWSHQDVPDVICEIGPDDDDILEILRMRLALHPIYQQAQDAGGLPVHAALVERRRQGALLIGDGGAGKSTCCLRLPAPWGILCDDEVLIIPDGERGYFAHPFPTWSDYILKRSERTWNVEKHVALSAIFFLEQAKIDEVVPTRQGQAAVLLSKSSAQVCRQIWIDLVDEEKRRLRRRAFENACGLAKVIPAFKLRVSLDGRFWEEMEKVLH